MPPLAVILFLLIALILVPVVVILFLEDRRSRDGLDRALRDDGGDDWSLDARSPAVRRLAGERGRRGLPGTSAPPEASALRTWRDASAGILLVCLFLFVISAVAFGFTTSGVAPTERPSVAVVVTDSPSPSESPSASESSSPDVSGSPGPSPTATLFITFPPLITPPPATPKPSTTPSPTPTHSPSPSPSPTPTATATIPPTPAPAVPGAPVMVGVSPGSTTPDLIVTWTAPADNGGSPILGYEVYRGTVPGGPYETHVGVGVPALKYKDSTGTAGITYYYVVFAVNAVGPSASSSAEGSATAP